jgi:hypothetical protein
MRARASVNTIPFLLVNYTTDTQGQLGLLLANLKYVTVVGSYFYIHGWIERKILHKTVSSLYFSRFS